MMFVLTHWQKFAKVAVLIGMYLWIKSYGYGLAETKYQSEIATIKLELAGAREQALAAAQEQTLLLGTIAINEAALAAKARVETKVVTETIVKWKVKYASHPDSGKCNISPEFVRVHTAAAANRVSEAPPGGPQSDGAATGITDIEVLGVDTANYATCHQWADQLRHWQAREKALEAVAP